MRVATGAMARMLVALVVALVASATVAPARAADPPSPSPAPDPVAGQGYFAAICSTCHGVDASGIPEMGRNLRSNAFVAKSDVATIVAFIQKGHPPTPQWPEGMPPDGSSSYDAQKLADIAAWLKSLQGKGS